MGNPSGEVTLLLGELILGNELRRIAGYYMRDERAGHTLQPTALVNEAYLRLTGQTRADWRNRTYFLGVAARWMRRILVDHARERAAAKRGGPLARIDLEQSEIGPTPDGCEALLAVKEALVRLREFDPQQERVVELRFCGGLTVEETAEALRISPRTVKREWAMARAWLRAELAGEAAG